MDSPSWNFRRGDTRASDAERDQAVAELSEHFQAGRLTQEEFEDRSGRALQARTGGDLSVLFTDLPQNAVPVPAAPGPAAGRVPGLSPGGVRRPGRAPVARIVIACVIALVIAGSALGDTGHSNGHASFGWLVPVVIGGFVLLRLARRRR
jgi:Domain of unknown function (DUF1707)